MSKRGKPQTEVEQQVVALTIKLVQFFRSNRIIDFSEIGKLFFKETDDPELEVECRLVWQIIDILQTNNPQISPRLIFSLLISEVVGIIVLNPYDPRTDDEFADMAREKVEALIKYSSKRLVDIPIFSFAVDGPPIKIGKTTFHSVTDEDRSTEWWKKLGFNFSGNPETEVLSYGRVTCPGDWEIALNFAEAAINESLHVLRGIGFPFISENVNQFGVLNEFPVRSSRPIRLHKPLETVRIDSSSTVITRLGPPIRVWRIYTDILNNIEDSVIININQLLDNEKDSTLTVMQLKLISGLRWIGEATKPDTLPARYLKLAIGLEYLIGGESSDKNLATRGITATLAERAAFLIGKDQEHRLSIHKEVRKYYGLRSEIVHVKSDTITGTDFVEFGSMVRQIALALCQKTSDFKDIDALQRWVFQLRYT